MNYHFSKIIVFLLLLCDPIISKAHVGLDYPLGGETFIVGQSIIIQWHVVVPHDTENWDLLLSLDAGVTWDTIILNIPTEVLSYEWVIPDNITSLARVRVIQDNADQNYQDNSMNFSIVSNTAPPLLDAPANDIVIECNPADQEAAVQTWLDNHGGASVTNYCGELIWSHDYTGYSNDCGATGSTLVIFTAADECGMLMTNALLTIADTSPPAINNPASNEVVESNGQGNVAQLNFWLNNQGGAQASDHCGDVTWSHNFSTLSDECGATGSAMVTFAATDECGNTSTTVATFTIQDLLAPNIIVAAQGTSFACGVSNQNQIQQWLNQHGGAEAVDLGGDVTWSHDYAGLSDGCGATGSAVVIFTASDECGNSTMTNATVSVEDITAPLINVPATNSTLECEITDQDISIQQWLTNNGGAQATDDCSTVFWGHNFTALNNGCGASGMANVIFTATDGCGNSSTTSASIRTEDNSAPVMETQAQDIIIVCGVNEQPTEIQNWLNQQGGAVARDLCGDITWTHNFPALSDTCGPVGSHTIRFTATDECGHTIFSEATLTIVDSLMTSVLDPGELNLKIYPNPASDVIHVSLDKSDFESIDLLIFDAFGKLHWNGNYTTSEMLIPVSNYPQGVYIIELRTAKGRFARTVVVQ
jgi:hypothetical protein